MKFEIHNTCSTIDGKCIAFPRVILSIEGEQYPIALKCIDERDKRKLNKALKARGFLIGQIGETQVDNVGECPSLVFERISDERRIN